MLIRALAFTKFAQTVWPALPTLHHEQPVTFAHVALSFWCEQVVWVEFPHSNTLGGRWDASLYVWHELGTAAHLHQEHDELPKQVISVL